MACTGVDKQKVTRVSPVLSCHIGVSGHDPNSFSLGNRYAHN